MTGRDDALAVTGLRLRYGRKGPWALDDLSCRFPRGAISGLVGPNGAGKTTLYAVVCGFLRPDAGTVDLLGGGPFDPERLQGRVGVLPQDADLPERLTAEEFLRFMAALQGLGDTTAAARRALQQVRLTDRAGARVEALSHGMRRRLAVASALLGEPELVLLDEPTAGLDPEQAASLREVLRALRGRCSVVVSSHDLSELERLCDWVVLMHAGRVTRQGTVAEVTGRGERALWELGDGDLSLDALRAVLPGHGLELTARDDRRVLVQQAPAGESLDESSTRILVALAEAGVPLRGLVRGRSLEETFLATLRG